MAEEQAARGVFVIDDEEIPFPDFSEGFSFDEAMAFYDYTGYPLEDLIVSDDMDDEEREEVTGKMRSPHVLAALMHIGYSRAHPKAKDSNIRKLVKSTSFAEALSKLADTDEEAEEGDPPSVESTSTPSESSTSKSVDSEPTSKPASESSGIGSQNGSSEPENAPAPTGPGRSGTSSPGSDQTTSALYTPPTY